MPVYSYLCEGCGKGAEQFRRVSKRKRNRPKCPKCGRPMKLALSVPGRSPDQRYAKPVLSDSMGVAPAQVAEHRRLHPTIPILDDGRVVVRSHSEGKRIRKALGFFDKDGYSK